MLPYAIFLAFLLCYRNRICFGSCYCHSTDCLHHNLLLLLVRLNQYFYAIFMQCNQPSFTIEHIQLYRWKRRSGDVSNLSLSSRFTLQKSKIKDNLAMSHVTVPDLPTDTMVASHEPSEPGTLSMQANNKGNILSLTAICCVY